jgi:hypothetical protein
MQPRADRLEAADRVGPPEQDQERGLKGVVGKVQIAQFDAANAHHQRSVPLDEGPKRFGSTGIPASSEPVQELRIGSVTEPSQAQERLDRLVTGAKVDHGWRRRT